jgi:hypothetical protein
MDKDRDSAFSPAALEVPGTFFEGAIEAVENSDTSSGIQQIQIKASRMAALANRLRDPALRAEADMIARLAAEKLSLLPPGAKAGRIRLHDEVSRAPAGYFKRP